MINTADLAKNKGYTKPVIAEADEYTLYLLVRPNADLDGRFTAFDTDNNEFLTINGWNFIIDDNGE